MRKSPLPVSCRLRLAGALAATLLLGLPLAGASAAGAQPLPSLFRDAPLAAAREGAGKGAGADLGVLRRRWVELAVDFDRLAPADSTRLKSALDVRLDLFADAAYTAHLVPEPSPFLPYVVWRGPIDGIEGSQVLLVAGGGQVVASVDALDRFYRVRHAGREGGAEVHAVEEMARLGTLGDRPAFEVDDLEPGEKESFLAELAAPPKAEGPRDDGTRLDVLVVYTPQAKAEMGDDAVAIQNLIALGIASLDTTLVRSRIDMRARLVQAVEVSYEEDPDVGLDLDRLRRVGDGYLEEVHALRDRHHADVVSLVRGTRNCSTPLQCGRGILMSRGGSPAFASMAFNVIAVDRVNDGTYALAHEIGHNFGCNHAPDDPVGVGAFDYSFGYKNPNAGFSTLMAYWCGQVSCPKVLHFSNPEVTVFANHPTGTESQNNARSIQEVRDILTNFRVSAEPTPGGGGSCKPKRANFLACQGDDGCSVCALKIAKYPRYLLNHPDCKRNDACKGKRFLGCSKSCPPPTTRDK